MKPGTTVAILGPSGSGKSSFLAALTGQARAYGRVDGSLFLASDAAPTSWHRTALSSLAALVGFVPQADVMLRSLSVRSVLEFAGSWRRRGRVAQTEDIDDAVNRVLAGLDLEHVQDSLIGEERRRGISGGEVRRVNVGLELMARPSILLADEPTSGLDSAAAVRVCQLFQRVASNGVLVVCVIHQPRPEIFDMFDQLLVFGKGGILTYAGPRVGAAEYFGAHFRVLPRPGQNVADFLLDVVSDSTPEQIATLGRVWAEQHGSLPFSQPPGLSDAVGRFGAQDDTWLGSQTTASFAKVYRLCIRRTAELYLSEWRAERTFAILFFVVGMIVGILVPFTSFRYRVQAILLTSLSAGLAASYRSLNTFGDKLSVIWRESRAGMNRPAFYLGTLTFELLIPNIYLPFCLMMGLFFLLGPHGSFGDMYLAIALGFWPFAALGRLMSLLMARETTQMATVLLVIGLHINGSLLPTISEMASFPAVNSETVARAMLATSPARWIVEYMYAIELGAFPPSRTLEADAELDFYSYRRDATDFVPFFLILQGMAFDFLALAAMMLLHRPEQNRAKWRTVVRERMVR
jgi:ABC-type multidrug transport system ATPase subunit